MRLFTYHTDMTQLEKAALYAMEQHQDQIRKGASQTPYIGHCWVVAGTVMDYTQNEEVHCAALLHDIAEDCGGLVRLHQINSMFGKNVAQMVLECSDSTLEDRNNKLPWKERKEACIAKVPFKSNNACLIMAADKLHNLTCTVDDIKRRGDNAFGCFRGKKEGTKWYYTAMLARLAPKIPQELDKRLQDKLQELYNTY